MRIFGIEITIDKRTSADDVVWVRAPRGATRLGYLTAAELREELASIKNEIANGNKLTINKHTHRIHSIKGV